MPLKQNLKRGGFLIGSMILWLLVSISMSLAQGDTWTIKGNMPDERGACSSCAVGGIIYVIGGASFESNPNAINTVYAYDPANDTWTTKKPMPTARFNFSTSALNNKIYAMGGGQIAGELPTLNIVEEYDPSTDTWSTKAPMLTPRKFFGTCAVNGKIYAIGGMNYGEPLKSVEEYDPVTNVWIEKAPMSTARNYLSYCLPEINAQIYVIGGAPGRLANPISLVEEYDPATDNWSIKQPMPTARLKIASSAVNGMIYAIGGGFSPTDNGLKIVEEFNPVTNAWVRRTDMPTGRIDFATTALNGKIYAIGGLVSYSPLTAAYAIEEYTSPTTGVISNSWDQTLPKEFLLDQNYPNPFNAQTMIEYQIATAAHVMLEISNVLGQKIRTLVDKHHAAGRFHAIWDGKDSNGKIVPSGVYFYNLKAERYSISKKMLLVR